MHGTKRHNTHSTLDAMLIYEQNELDQLVAGHNMAVGQPCNVAGYNIQDETIK